MLDPNLHLRSATLSDVSRITSLVVPRVSHDGFHDYFFPHQNRYPHDFVRWWRRYYRDLILRPYWNTLLVEDSKGGIQGLAVWGYAPKMMGIGDAGDVPEPRGVNIAKDSWFEVIQRCVYSWIDKVQDIFHPNRCTDPTALLEWRKTVSDMNKRLWSGKDRIHWYCPEFFTFEEEQEKNPLASVLLGWGPEQSKVDDVSTFVLTLTSLGELYEGLGYTVVDEVECGPSRCIAMKCEE